MNKVKINCSWDLSFELFHEKKIELFVDFYGVNNSTDKDTVKILFILEPPEIVPQFTQMAINMQDRFDFILTHNEDILKNCKNAVLFEFGSTWIKQPYAFSEKTFEVSTLVGGKLMAPGHHLRQKLWYKQNRILTPTKFFYSGNMHSGLENYNNNPVLGDKKEPMFDSQFHIVIENVKRNNWFTEKLIDAFYTKTVPIYYGCPNIGNYFDPKGMFIVDSVNEIVDVCNNLNENTYKEMKEPIEKNFELCKKFINIAERLVQKIEKLVDE
jgi:hypothetical protein